MCEYGSIDSMRAKLTLFELHFPMPDSYLFIIFSIFIFLISLGANISSDMWSVVRKSVHLYANESSEDDEFICSKKKERREHTFTTVARLSMWLVHGASAVLPHHKSASLHRAHNQKVLLFRIFFSHKFHPRCACAHTYTYLRIKIIIMCHSTVQLIFLCCVCLLFKYWKKTRTWRILWSRTSERERERTNWKKKKKKKQLHKYQANNDNNVYRTS